MLPRLVKGPGTSVVLCLLQGKARDPVRGNLVYPYSFGQQRSVLFFAEVRVFGHVTTTIWVT